MSRRTIGVIGALLVSVAGLSAQHAQLDLSQFDPQNWFKEMCPACGVHGFVDYPARGATTLRRGFVVAGWGFECVSGRVVDRVDVFYEVGDNTWRPLKQPVGSLRFGSVNRPDVSTAYERWCPNVPGNAGWWMTVTNPPPPGARRIRFNLWSGPYRLGVTRTYNFIDR